MATKNVFAAMLNQKPVQAPQIKAPGIKVNKPPGVSEFAYMGQGNSLFRHPMENRGNDVSQGVWARMMKTMKPKGPGRI